MMGKEASAMWLLWAGLLVLCVAGLSLLFGGPLAPSQALAPLAVDVFKSVDPAAIEPGHLPAPLYTVTFANSESEAVILDAITDTLPAGFVFSGMHPSSDWHEGPADPNGPEIVWQGPITVPATNTLSLVYAVYVPSTVPGNPIPYENTVVAGSGEQLFGPAHAYLLVGRPELGLDKSAAPERVLNGEPVTYTVTITNSGELTGTVDVISDTLDAGLSFSGMTGGSDVTDPPQQAGDTLVWTGPFEVAPAGDLVVEYVVTTPGGSDWSWPCNRVEVSTADGTIGPAESCIVVGPERTIAYLPVVYKQVRWAHFTIDKTVTPESLMALAGAEVTYTVTIVNPGDYPGVLDSVYDVLPAGFTYVDMVPGSDVMDDPSGTTGTITWDGPFNVAAHTQLRLIYRATINQTPGQYVNLANVTTLVGNAPRQPASAMVIVQPAFLLEEDFDSGIDLWTPFLNYHRLEPGQWYWGPADGVNGSGGLTHDCCVGRRVAADALMMYLQPGAEEWTDYRVETKLYLTGGVDGQGNYEPESGDPIGLWVRGQWEPSDREGQWVTGYYVVVAGKSTSPTHVVRLTQMQIAGDCTTSCQKPWNMWSFQNTFLLQESAPISGPFEHYRWYELVVEVHENHIQAWLDGQLVIDYVDEVLPHLEGTVGLKVHETKTASFDDLVVTPLP